MLTDAQANAAYRISEAHGIVYDLVCDHVRRIVRVSGPLSTDEIVAAINIFLS